MKVRRRIAAIGGLAVVVAAATIGSVVATSGVAGARPAPKTRAAIPTTAAFDLSVSVQTTSTTFSGSIVGNVNFGTGQVEGTINIPEGIGTIISAIAPKLASLVPAAVAADTSAQVIFTGQTLYLDLAGLPIGNKQWVALSLNTSGGIGSAFKTVGKGLENIKNLGHLTRRLGVTTTSLGTKSINGVNAQGYSASVSSASILRILPHHGRKTTTSGVTSALGSTPVSVQVWAQHAGPVVQVTITAAPPASSSIGSVNISLNLSNWGAPVTITAPPASEVLLLPFSL
jgi:hypothetical protein